LNYNLTASNTGPTPDLNCSKSVETDNSCKCKEQLKADLIDRERIWSV